MARRDLTLIQNGIAKSLGSDASAIGDEEDSAVGHGSLEEPTDSG
jgi:hypothetical protein